MPRSILTEDESRSRRLVLKARRHWDWGRTQGWGRLIEEDQLDPVLRAKTAARKWQWRRRHGIQPGTATAVFLVGLQRSGTNMVVKGLEASPEFEVHNENDRRAFREYRLRSDPTVRRIVERSRHRHVLFKPLCDSHRTVDLLDGLGTQARPRAIWVYRNLDGRVRSALAKFGDANLRALRQIAAGQGDSLWQAGRLSPHSLHVVRSFDYDSMTPASAAALFWYVRNSLLFELGLHERDDVFVMSYDALVADPVPPMRALCNFLSIPWDPRLVAHISDRSSHTSVVPGVDPRIRHYCDTLQRRLDESRSTAT